MLLHLLPAALHIMQPVGKVKFSMTFLFFGLKNDLNISNTEFSN